MDGRGFKFEVEVMKKIYEFIKKYSVTVLFIMISLFVISFVLKINMPTKTASTVALFYIIIALIYLLFMGFFIVAMGFHNFSSCDDKLFDIIDSFCRKGVNSDCRMKDFIRVINYYYADGGIVDEKIVEVQDIQRLYK